MATGSITSLGLGSGLELQSMLDQLKAADKAPITAKENQKTELQQEIDAYNSINAKLLSIKSDALSLSLESDFLKTTSSVSDEDILTASVNDGIAESSAAIEVTKKARFNSWQTTGVSSKSSQIYTEPETEITDVDESVTTESTTMAIMYGALESQQEISISLDSGMSLTEIAEAVNSSNNNQDAGGSQLVTASVEKNSNDNYYIRISAASGGNSADSQVNVSGFDYVKADTAISLKRADSSETAFMTIAPGTTYEQAADIINSSSDNPGVTAQIIDDGSSENPYKLTLISNSTGEDNRISIQNLPMTEVTGAGEDSLNAEFSVNGIAYQRQSNDGIDDVISGVTFNIQETGETTFSVQHDTDQVKEHIIALVDGFNKLISEIKGTDSDTENDADADAEESSNPLEDSYTIKRMMYNLQSLIGTTIDTDSEYSSLYDLGMEINQDGTFSLDENTLDQAFALNPDAVNSFFLGDSDINVTGLGDIINDGITNMVSSQGTITTQIDAAEIKMDRLNSDIETATERLNKRYETMAEEFVKLDTYISQLNSEANYMQSMIDSFNESKSN